MSKSSGTFRSCFQLGKSSTAANWFPRHMYSGLKQMQSKLRSVDCVIEVHDARMPLSGRNPDFYRMLYAIKPHILVLNKADLVDTVQLSRYEKILRNQQKVKNIMWTDCKSKDQTALRKLTKLIIEEVQNAPRYSRLEVYEYGVMVVGIPNTGKSSLINSLRSLNLQRSGDATAVGNRPGVTRSVMNKIKISESPPVYLLDTPGILLPDLKSVETSMKLALCETIVEKTFGPVKIADFLLFWLNKTGNFQYCSHLHLEKPSDDINEVLMEFAMRTNLVRISRTVDGSGLRTVVDLDTAAQQFLAKFRLGKFGKLILDADLLPK